MILHTKSYQTNFCMKIYFSAISAPICVITKGFHRIIVLNLPAFCNVHVLQKNASIFHAEKNRAFFQDF